MDRAPAVGALLYGRHPVLEALRAGRRLQRLLVAQGAHGQPVRELIAEAEARGVAVEFVPRERLDVVGPHHQGVVAEAEPFAYTPLDELLRRLRAPARSPLVLATDGVQDPQNLGSLLRTAAAVAADGVVLPERRAAGITPAVAKASAGAIERLPIVQVANLVRALEALKALRLWVVGLAGDGRSLPWEIDLTAPTVLIVGSEGAGLGRLVREHCDFTVRLPMPGRVESLNAAVAGSIVLYEALRQRLSPTRSKGGRPPSEVR
ncbi:MAG: 23S rRNA (guanosine(2251)-2'-O)-methyltransferase RlmB [Chloroflexi bacterium]|nr:23S rRNA (guanosine(2251)-2'-O)-methyltransferase RlmB [Chloroflexota bacterium]